MDFARFFPLLGVMGMALAGCANVDAGFRELPQGRMATEPQNYKLAEFNSLAPETLTISDANLYYPVADVVWRGDPFGDRLSQVEAIFDAAAEEAEGSLDGARPVRATAQVTRFHSVTEKARVSVGGVHSIRFYLTVYDRKTNELLEGPRLVIADLPALGGENALASDREGDTMKTRITEHLKLVLVDELTGTTRAARPR
ncbi:MAG: DUF6778 family protein [Pseudomonadota bacterium]